MSLPLGLYGLPISSGGGGGGVGVGGGVGHQTPGEETVMTQASNDAYAEFRRQMLSQVNATKSKRKSSISIDHPAGGGGGGGNSRPCSVAGDSDDNNAINGRKFLQFSGGKFEFWREI